MNPLKMYFLLKMGMFHCYVSLPEGNLLRYPPLGRKILLSVCQREGLIFLQNDWSYLNRHVFRYQLTYETENKRRSLFSPVCKTRVFVVLSCKEKNGKMHIRIPCSTEIIEVMT